jgi:predicted  nucleic acid-binding Zn-ribbon protein
MKMGGRSVQELINEAYQKGIAAGKEVGSVNSTEATMQMVIACFQKSSLKEIAQLNKNVAVLTEAVDTWKKVYTETNTKLEEALRKAAELSAELSKVKEELASYLPQEEVTAEAVLHECCKSVLGGEVV